ncbi:MAG: HAMP domain-containing histidine kinase [Deltaproteobacteria bacterium]|nr:HAMP domain-containing histidine kinase [Deltaproteobacteria bacterium]
MSPEPIGVRLGRLRSLRLRTMLVVVVVLVVPLVLAATVRWSDWRIDDLARLTFLSLPAVLALGWWLGWRMVSPLEQLQQQVLEKVAEPHPRADLDLGRRDEFGALAEAFNTLLARLESRSRAHEAFVADLAHELRNPVAAIRAAAESLGQGDVDDARAVRLARVLEDSGRRLDDLLSQLLELARTEAGLMREVRVPLDLAALLRGVIEAMRTDPRYAAVRFELEAGTGAELLAVPLHLETALRNLLDNAASFAGGGGWVRAIVRPTPTQVEVRIADSGPGVRSEDLPRVFDRFFTTRGDQRGVGLGLALVRAVAEAHGGSVSAESPPGEGAAFTLVLPRTKAPQ